MTDRLRRLTRRDALSVLGRVIAPFAGGAVLGYAAHDQITQPKTQESPTNIDVLPPTEKTMTELLQEILDLPPFLKPFVDNPERVRKENEYVGRVSKNPNLKDIDRGFWVLAHQPSRAELLNLRYSLRQSGNESKLAKISKEMLDWTEKWRIHPEVLGIILDNYERGRKKITELNDKDRLRDDHYKLKTPDKGMINAGGLAMLITMETGPIDFRGESFGFTNIGQDMAINQMFGGDAQKNRAALDRISEIFFRKTGLRLNPKYIAGSVIGKNDKSGGAIAVQFLSENADKVEILVEDVSGEILNVFDVNDSTIMIWVFLARDELVGKDIDGKNLYRVGYRRGVDADVKNAIIKWFGAPGNPADKTEEAAYDFYSNFLAPKPSQTP